MSRSHTVATEDFKACVRFHGHACGGLAIGYMAGIAAMAWFDEQRSQDEELVAIVENDACGVDAIQVLTGCTFGKGNLIFKDYGKMAFTFFSRKTGHGIRLVAKPRGSGGNEHFQRLIQKRSEQQITSSELSELKALMDEKINTVLNTPLRELFEQTEVKERLPSKARIAPSKPCAKCGEATMETKLHECEGKLFCRGCFNEKDS